MAEFCLECLNKISGLNYSPNKYIISKDLDLCEECGQLKPVVVRVKRRYLFVERLRDLAEAYRERH